jgi:AsmA family protein
MSWKKFLFFGTLIVAALIIGAYILLSTYNYNSLKPRIAAAVKNATGRELVLGEKIKLKFGLSPALVLGNIAFQNAPWGSRPDMITVKRLEIQVALIPLILGHIDVKRFMLIQPDILIETNRSGVSNLLFLAKQQSASSSTETMPPSGGHLELPALSVADVEIEQADVTYREGKTGKSYRVQISRLSASAAGSESPIALRLKSVYSGKPLEISGTAGTWAAITSRQQCPLDLTGRFGEIHVAVKGIIKDVPNLRHVDLDIQAKAKDLADLKPFVGEPLPSQGPFETALRITDPSYRVYRLSELKVGLGPGKLSGSVEADLSKDRPLLSAVLASERLDLRPLLAEKKATPAGAATKEALSASHGKVFSKTPFPLEALGKADVMIKARVDKILLPDVAIDALTAEIALKAGELKINPLKGTVGGGSLGASLDLEPEGATALIKTEVKVEQLDLGRMMKELGRGNSLEGLLNVHVDVNGKGASEADMMSKLNGRVILTMHRGKIENRYIHLLGGELSSNLFLLLNPFRKQVNYTAVECLVSGFNIGHGIATTTALVVVTDEMAIIGEGDVNLGTEELDLPLKLVPKGAIAGIPSELGFNIAEVTKPFKLAGTLAHPSLAIDTTRAGETIAKAIGGIALFGPAGIAAALVTGSPGDGDLCRVAAEAAQKGLKLSVVEEKNKGTGVAGEAVQGLEKGLGEIGKGIEGLFGK